MNSVSLRMSRLYFSGSFLSSCLLADHLVEDPLALGDVRFVVEVHVLGGVPLGAGDHVLGLALGAEDRGEDGDDEDAEDDGERECRC